KGRCEMRTLYFDCFSGLSGDMVIGALIDAGADPDVLVAGLEKLHIEDEYELKWYKVIKNGITSTKFDVILHQDHGHSHDDDHHDSSHSHGHDHDHDHHHHHRTYRHIKTMIETADLSEQVKDTALNIFKKIAQAEGQIHGVPLEDVHFHEVGAVDSIIDIVGAAILLDHLNADVIKYSQIPVGSWQNHNDHRIYPVPAPTTMEILRGLPNATSELKAELTTPTGAAVAAVMVDDFTTLPAMTVDAIGYGAGTKQFPDHPNVLRVVIGHSYNWFLVIFTGCCRYRLTSARIYDDTLFPTNVF